MLHLSVWAMVLPLQAKIPPAQKRIAQKQSHSLENGLISLRAYERASSAWAVPACDPRRQQPSYWLKVTQSWRIDRKELAEGDGGGNAYQARRWNAVKFRRLRRVKIWEITQWQACRRKAWKLREKGRVTSEIRSKYSQITIFQRKHLSKEGKQPCHSQYSRIILLNKHFLDWKSGWYSQKRVIAIIGKPRSALFELAEPKRWINQTVQIQFIE
jgi:hypothetical protein